MSMLPWLRTAAACLPGHLETQPCWGSIEVCCPQPVEAASPLSHKQCRERGARMCGEWKAVLICSS